MAAASLDPSTVEDIFKNFTARRDGIVRALTTDVDTFSSLCDSAIESICLYGFPNGSWEVKAFNLPPEKVLLQLPKPLGHINITRVQMNRREWLLQVAKQSNNWLYSVALYYSIKLHENVRQQLFDLIHDLPTVYEVVSEAYPVEDKPNVESGSESEGKAEVRYLAKKNETFMFTVFQTLSCLSELKLHDT